MSRREESEQIKLKGVHSRTTSWVRITSTGVLEADSAFSCDAAFIFVVSVRESRPTEITGRCPAEEQKLDDRLLACISDRFADYHNLKKWMEKQGVPFQSHNDPWA